MRQSLKGPTLVDLSHAAGTPPLPHPPSIGVLCLAALELIVSVLARIRSALQGVPPLYPSRALSRRAAGVRLFHRHLLLLPHPHHGHPTSRAAGRSPIGFDALDCPSRRRRCSCPQIVPPHGVLDGILGMHHPSPAMRRVCYYLQDGAGVVLNARLGRQRGRVLQETDVAPCTRTLGVGLTGASSCQLERTR